MRMSAHDCSQLLRHTSYVSYVGHVSDAFIVSPVCSTSYVSCASSMRHVMGFLSHAGGVSKCAMSHVMGF